MNPTLKNILAVLAGIVVGSFVNMGLIKLTSGMVALPEGVDPTNMESISANIHLYSPANFISPFLAHAIGTLAGAFAAVKIAASHHRTLALFLGGWFLLGGIVAVYLLPNTPMWFILLDLIGAYFPMALLGWKLGGGDKMNA